MKINVEFGTGDHTIPSNEYAKVVVVLTEMSKPPANHIEPLYDVQYPIFLVLEGKVVLNTPGPLQGDHVTPESRE